MCRDWGEDDWFCSIFIFWGLPLQKKQLWSSLWRLIKWLLVCWLGRSGVCLRGKKNRKNLLASAVWFKFQLDSSSSNNKKKRKKRVCVCVCKCQNALEKDPRSLRRDGTAAIKDKREQQLMIFEGWVEVKAKSRRERVCPCTCVESTQRVMKRNITCKTRSTERGELETCGRCLLRRGVYLPAHTLRSCLGVVTKVPQ